jgi:hypothetical protein
MVQEYKAYRLIPLMTPLFNGWTTPLADPSYYLRHFCEGHKQQQKSGKVCSLQFPNDGCAELLPWRSKQYHPWRFADEVPTKRM